MSCVMPTLFDLAPKCATCAEVRALVVQLGTDLRKATDPQFSRSLMIGRVNTLRDALDTHTTTTKGQP